MPATALLGGPHREPGPSGSFSIGSSLVRPCSGVPGPELLGDVDGDVNAADGKDCGSESHWSRCAVQAPQATNDGNDAEDGHNHRYSLVRNHERGHQRHPASDEKERSDNKPWQSMSLAHSVQWRLCRRSGSITRACWTTRGTESHDQGGSADDSPDDRGKLVARAQKTHGASLRNPHGDR